MLLSINYTSRLVTPIVVFFRFLWRFDLLKNQSCETHTFAGYVKCQTLVVGIVILRAIMPFFHYGEIPLKKLVGLENTDIFETLWSLHELYELRDTPRGLSIPGLKSRSKSALISADLIII